MKICRFDENRLGVVNDGFVHDVSEALTLLPFLQYPLPHGDLLFVHLDAIVERASELLPKAERIPLENVRLLSPVANPGKIIGAPVNYNDHLEESKTDPGLAHGHNLKPIWDMGLFLKANTSLVGAGEGIDLRFPDRRNDHEAELAVVIGKTGTKIAAADAEQYIAGYAIGLDMTVRGPQFKCVRASIDTYGVLGPWLTTRDEVASTDDLNFSLTVNGEPRQASSTRYLIYNVAKLIEFASSYYTLHPGDVIMTGTPAGVAPVVPGDRIHVEFDLLGSMDVDVRGYV